MIDPPKDDSRILPNIRRLRGNVVPGLQRMPPAIEFLPPEIAAAEMYCSHCETKVPVPLKKTFSEPYTPVFPLDYDPLTNNKFWQLLAVEVECPRCSCKVRLEPPTKRWTKNVSLYGDEAVREGIMRPFVCIALVGGSNRHVERVCNEVTALKNELEPARDPTSWRFHMTDLRSGQRRKRHQVFATWDREKCEQSIARLFDIIRSTNDELFVFASVYPVADSEAKMLAKRKAYMALLCDTINGFTSVEASPRYIFDADRDVGANAAVLQQWARTAFLGSERQLMYLFLSHGVPVPEPQFVKQGSHMCLELADLVAFVVARELYCAQAGRETEHPSSGLGQVYYSWPDPQGYARWRGQGVPTDRIFR